MSELYHYGVKGMKWHEHRMARDDSDDGSDRRRNWADRLREEAANIQKTADEAYTVVDPAKDFITNPSEENLQALWNTYNNISPEARNMINAFVADQVRAFSSDLKQNWAKYLAQGAGYAAGSAANAVYGATHTTTTYSTNGTLPSDLRDRVKRKN